MLLKIKHGNVWGTIMSKINSNFYTKGRFSKMIRETLDTDYYRFG